jgi:hypothetical protein
MTLSQNNAFSSTLIKPILEQYFYKLLRTSSPFPPLRSMRRIFQIALKRKRRSQDRINFLLDCSAPEQHILRPINHTIIPPERALTQHLFQFAYAFLMSDIVPRLAIPVALGLYPDLVDPIQAPSVVPGQRDCADDVFAKYYRPARIEVFAGYRRPESVAKGRSLFIGHVSKCSLVEEGEKEQSKMV